MKLENTTDVIRAVIDRLRDYSDSPGWSEDYCKAAGECPMILWQNSRDEEMATALEQLLNQIEPTPAEVQ